MRGAVSVALHLLAVGAVAVWVWRRRPQVVVIEVTPLDEETKQRMWERYSGHVARLFGVEPARNGGVG